MTRTRYYQTVRESRPAIDWRVGLTQIAFGLALALVVARCMALETIRDPLEVSIGSSDIPLARREYLAGFGLALWPACDHGAGPPLYR